MLVHELEMLQFKFSFYLEILKEVLKSDFMFSFHKTFEKCCNVFESGIFNNKRKPQHKRKTDNPL